MISTSCEQRGEGRRVVLSSLVIQCVPALVFLGAVVAVGELWFSSSAPWMHPELTATARHVWTAPGRSIGEKVGMVFNWKTFDPNVNRVRPLNDLAEIIDHTSRPRLVPLVGAHPSLTPIAAVTAVACPLLLFGFFRRYLDSHGLAFLLTALFVSCTGYLSVVIPYIRPAKKLALLGLCATLLLAVTYEHRRSLFRFLALWGVLYLSFFTDEIALGHFVFCALLFHRSLWTEAGWARRFFFLALPATFLASVVWLLPAAYSHFGVHGAWNAFGDTNKVRLLGYLLEPAFYQAVLAGVARSLLSTFGVRVHTPITDAAALGVLIGLSGTLYILCRRASIPAGALARATLVLILGSAYATFLDWYPFPFEISYMGSYNFYYHCTTPVLVLLWMATVLSAARQLMPVVEQRKVVLAALGSAAMGMLICLNLALFRDVNALLQIIHTYPYSAESMHRTLNAHAAQSRRSRERCALLQFTEERASLQAAFALRAESLLGREWAETTFARVFGTFQVTPYWRREEIEYLCLAYFPRQALAVEILVPEPAMEAAR